METNTIWAPADSEKYQVFKQAASEGNVKQLETALRSGINVDALYGDGLEGYSVLHEAALKGNIEVIEYLLAHGANVDVRDAGQFGGSTPLIYAAQGAHVDAVRVLLDARADIDARGPNDDTVLSAVLPDGIQVTQRHIDTIILLLDYGVDINFRASAYGATVLEQAVKLADHNLINILHERGATLEGSLGIAAEFHENADTVNYLISQGVKDTTSYALARAARQNKIEIARVLLAQNPKAAPPGPHGALHMAALMGHSDMLTLLLDSGLDITTIDDYGRTPLHAACGTDNPSPKVVQTLLERGADPSAGNTKIAGTPYQGGDTPLHASAHSSNLEVIQLLLHSGANIAARNDVGETPLMRFAQKMSSHTICKEGANPRIEAFRELLNAGSEVNARDDQGRTALYILALDRFFDEEGYKAEAARLLLARGIYTSEVDRIGRTAAELLLEGDTGFEELSRSSV